MAYEEVFTDNFLAAMEEEREWTSVPEDQWRASGRKSKAWPDKENQDFWLTEGPKMVETWVNWWDGMVAEEGWKIWTTPAGTKAIELGIDGVSIGGITWRGHIDAVVEDGDGDLVIVDWKTGAGQPKSPMQLGEYACAIDALFRVRVKFGAFYNARKGDTGPLFVLDRFTDERVGKVLQHSRNIINKNLYVPNPGPLCGACGVRDWCWVMSDRPDKVAEVPDF